MTNTQTTSLQDADMVSYVRQHIRQTTGGEMIWRQSIRPLAYTPAFDGMVCMAYRLNASELTNAHRRHAWQVLLDACEDREGE